MTLESHMQLLSTVLGSAFGLKDGVALLKVWLRQRELDKVSWEWRSFPASLGGGLALSLGLSLPSHFQGLGGFSGFLVSMLVAFLVSTRKIHSTMSGYQVLRSVLQFLGKVARPRKAKGSTLPVNPLILPGIIQFVATTQLNKLNSGGRQL